MSVIGYVRVSTKEQTVENQIREIEKKFTVDKWFKEGATSGSTRASDRGAFKAMMSYVREGDTLVVTAIDRLGRNTIDILETVTYLEKEGVEVVSLREGFNLSTPIGKAMLGIMASLAQLEKDLIAERRRAGIERAKSEGKHMGRPIKATSEDVKKLLGEGLSMKEVTAKLGISRASYYRLKRDNV